MIEAQQDLIIVAIGAVLAVMPYTVRSFKQMAIGHIVLAPTVRVVIISIVLTNRAQLKPLDSFSILDHVYRAKMI